MGFKPTTFQPKLWSTNHHAMGPGQDSQVLRRYWSPSAVNQGETKRRRTSCAMPPLPTFYQQRPRRFCPKLRPAPRQPTSPWQSLYLPHISGCLAWTRWPTPGPRSSTPPWLPRHASGHWRQGRWLCGGKMRSLMVRGYPPDPVEAWLVVGWGRSPSCSWWQGSHWRHCSESG